MSVDIWSDKVRGAWKQQSQDGLEKIGTDQLFEFAGVVSEAFNHPRNAQRSLFDNFLVVRFQYAQQNRHHILDDRERILGDIPAAIGSCGDCGSLRTCGEEIEVSQASSKATFTDDRCRILD